MKWGPRPASVGSSVAGDERLDPSDSNVLRWHELLPFTTHRIRIASDLYTSRLGVDPEIDVRTEVVVERAKESGGIEGRRVLDLGCLEGAFALEFGRLGASEVLGIEVRDVSVERCRLARDLMGLDQVRFVCDDIAGNVLESSGAFDIVFAAGILYHVEDPAALLRRMKSICGIFALVDTHVATPVRPTHGCGDEAEYIAADGGERTYKGRWYPEFTVETTRREREQAMWASAQNERSFWPYEPELVRMIRDAGFRDAEKVAVSEPHRWQVDQEGRVLYVCWS